MQTKSTIVRAVSPDLAAVALPQTVPECHAVITELIERVRLLEERVNLDSNNSSKPPSSNGPGHMNRAQRRASQRKRGAQPGHKGHSRALLPESEVDRLVDCKPDAVCECGSPVVVADGPQRHQVFEVPPIRAQVDEYRLYTGRCTGGVARPTPAGFLLACPRVSWGRGRWPWSACSARATTSRSARSAA